jgi:hypothetical protein
MTHIPTDLAWAAGFIDGEGCVSLSKAKCKTTSSGVRFVLKLVVSQKRRIALDKLQSMFGGTVRRPASQDVWWWTVCTQDAAEVLRQLLPYLVEKHDQAVIAIAFQERRVRGRIQPKDQFATDNYDWALLAEMKVGE